MLTYRRIWRSLPRMDAPKSYRQRCLQYLLMLVRIACTYLPPSTTIRAVAPPTKRLLFSVADSLDIASEIPPSGPLPPLLNGCSCPLSKLLISR